MAVTTFEKGIEKGIEKGKEGQRKIALAVIEDRHGPLPDAIHEHLKQLSEEQLAKFVIDVIHAPSMDEIQSQLKSESGGSNSN